MLTVYISESKWKSEVSSPKSMVSGEKNVDKFNVIKNYKTISFVLPCI